MYEILFKAERESRKTLLHFPAALLNSPSRIPRENTHTLRRACAEETHGRKVCLSHLALVYHAFRQTMLRIHFPSRLFFDIIISRKCASEKKKIIITSACRNRRSNIRQVILSGLWALGRLQRDKFFTKQSATRRNSLPLASQVFIIPGGSSFRDKS